MKFAPNALAAAVALAFAGDAAADELKALRAEIAQMKQSYERRIEALEQRVAQAENRAAGAEAAAGEAREDARAATRAPAAANAFNPEISLILSGMYTNTGRDPTPASGAGPGGRERRIQGFLPSGGEFMPAARSWNLGESELAISANIDPLFRGNFRAAISAGNEVGVEEASIQTLALAGGFNLKAGRFLSGIGYANEQHPHEWDFSDAALPYQAFFGFRQGYDGVQLKWLAPTDLFVELGAETGRAQSFPATDAERNKNGFMSGSVFARAGGDVGVSHSWRAGLSLLATKPRDRAYEDLDNLGNWVTNSFSGTSRTAVADFVWKWAPGGNVKERSFKLQGEYLRRKESGTLTYDADAVSLGTMRDTYASVQSGWYAQGIWQFMPRWRVGYRYDQLRTQAMQIGLIDNGLLATADLPLLATYRPKRHTLMADWSPSEFSRIRLQWARDETRPDVADHQIWLHYIMSLGAHGAHKF